MNSKLIDRLALVLSFGVFLLGPAENYLTNKARQEAMPVIDRDNDANLNREEMNAVYDRLGKERESKLFFWDYNKLTS